MGAVTSVHVAVAVLFLECSLLLRLCHLAPQPCCSVSSTGGAPSLLVRGPVAGVLTSVLYRRGVWQQVPSRSPVLASLARTRDAVVSAGRLLAMLFGCLT